MTARTQKPQAHSPLFADSILEAQVASEKKALELASQWYRDLVRDVEERGEGASLKAAERLIIHWLRPVVAEIHKDRRAVRKGMAGENRQIYGPIYLELPAERLAVIAIHVMIGSCMATPDGVKVAKLSYEIGKAVIAEASLSRLRKQRITVTSKRTGEQKEMSALAALDRRFREVKIGTVNHWANRTLDDPIWNRRVCAHIGARLIWTVIGAASADDYDKPFRLAFRHFKQKIGSVKQAGFVKMDRRVFEIIQRGHEIRQYLAPRYLPMLVPPYPWIQWEKEGTLAKGIQQGGYALLRTPLISKPTGTQRKALETADLRQLFQCLNAVNGVAHRINKRRLAVVHEMYRQGGGELKIPLADNYPRPEPPVGYKPDAPLYERWKDVDRQVKIDFKRESHKVKAKNIRLEADREMFLRKIDIADRFKDAIAIFFPHRLDFRGRAYPLPLYLHHQGDDLCRGLLEFAIGKDARDDMDEIRIQAANAWGFDKLSFSERIQWAGDHEAEMRRCAADPLDSEWWRSAEDPWQFLAACQAIAYPEEAAHLPCGRDGTLNGLQHFVALGRDEAGAKLVNMTPADRPSDGYMEVTRVAAPRIAREAAAGNEIARMVLPLFESSKQARDLCKQPTMTRLCYNVTDVGARTQVMDKLRKIGIHDDDLFRAAQYLSKVVLDSVSQVCDSATSIMEWFIDCTRLIVTRTGEAAQWTTKLGFPVVQPYRRYYNVRIKTILQEITLAVEDETVPVKIKKQCNGSPPNIIHSFDATHMFMTGRECHSKGIVFIAVHDKYSTHASTRKACDLITREQFIEVHREDHLADLLSQWRKRHPNLDFPLPPPRGNYDLNTLIRCPYFFS